jgi:drug/metabolite transporter (DMT)-like permease
VVKVLERWTPWVFVLIWSSGFVVAKYAFEYSDVIYFLGIRLLIAGGILLLITLALGQSLRLTRKQLVVSIALGLTLQGLYLGGVWEAIAQGSPAGVASVVTSTQPILVSILAFILLKERLLRNQMIGLFLGFTGVLLVLWPAFSEAGTMTVIAFCLLIVGLTGSTSATLIQKKYGESLPLLAGTTYQFLFAGVILTLLSLFSNQRNIEWNVQSTLAMAWAVIVTSIIAVVALLWMLQRGSAAKVSSLLYLVPPVTAIQAWALFGEKLNAQAIIGIAMTALGVALVQRSA